MKETLLELLNTIIAIICLVFLATLFISCLIISFKFLTWLSLSNINFGGFKI